MKHDRNNALPQCGTEAEAFDASRIMRGIEAYQYQCSVLDRLLRKRGGFTSKEFDKWFRAREYKRPLSSRYVPISGESFILRADYWGQMLELLQCMVALGRVTARRKGSIVFYKANDEGNMYA